MKELAEKLKKQYEEKHYQSLISAKCNCGRFVKIIMSNYVSGGTLYAIVYCSRCDKFFFHHGGSCLEVCGETSYNSHNNEIEYDSENWNKVVKQIEQGQFFV